MLFETVYGHETFMNSGTVKIFNAYRQSGNSEAQMIEVAARDQHSGCIQIGRSDDIQAMPQNRNHGKWSIARFQLPSLSFVTVGISRKVPGALLPTMAYFVLYQREHAALRRLKIPFTGDPEAGRAFGYVEGRFDIISPSNFQQVGFIAGDKWAYTSSSDDIVEVRILENEIQELNLPSIRRIQTVSGKQTTVVRRTALRKINLNLLKK